MPKRSPSFQKGGGVHISVANSQKAPKERNANASEAQSESPARGTANTPLLTPRGLALGRGECDSRRLKPAGSDSERLRVHTRACEAGKCLRRLAACFQLPGSSSNVSPLLQLAWSLPSLNAEPAREVGSGQGGRAGGLHRARGAATFPSNGCDDAFNSLRAGQLRTC